MTRERRAEINRRLARFEFTLTGFRQMPNGKIWAPGANAGSDFDYTDDLNALARLEAKLPLHAWRIIYYQYANHRTIGAVYESDNGFDIGSGEQATEAEARAEAIYLYLTSKVDK